MLKDSIMMWDLSTILDWNEVLSTIPLNEVNSLFMFVLTKGYLALRCKAFIKKNQIWKRHKRKLSVNDDVK